MGRKKTYIEVLKDFEKQNVKLLVTEEEFVEVYKNNTTKLKYLCSCLNIDEKSLNSIQDGKKCNKCLNERKKQTLLKNHGVDNPSKSKIIQDKKKETFLFKYGVENPLKNEIIKNKIKETNLERYGVENPMQNESIKNKTKETNLLKYGFECVSKNECVKQKMKETNLERYGVEYTLQNKEFKQKAKQTNLERYGVENVFTNEYIKEKIKKTLFNNYGVQNPMHDESIKEKLKQTNLEKYGFEYASQNESIKEKLKQTNLYKYGVEYPMQNKEFFEEHSKKCFTKKEYICPSGNILLYQGYENFALDELIFEEEINENDIILALNNVPEIWYTDENKIKNRYYTDIYVKSQNKCIEVKSEYTYSCNKDIFELKKNATLESGYNFELRIYDKKGKRI